MLAVTQLLMRPTKIVGASKQIPSCFQWLQTMSRMTAFSGERSQPFPHRCIEPFNQGRIELLASCGLLEQFLGSLKGSSCQGTRDFHYPFFLGMLDNGSNTESGPDFQTTSSSASRPFHFFSKGPQHAVWVRIPAIGADEQPLHEVTTPTNLLE
jgi:hypothetical protein